MDDPSICQSDVLKSFLSTAIQNPTNLFAVHDSIVGGIAGGVPSFFMSSHKREGGASATTVGVGGSGGGGVGTLAYEDEQTLGGSGSASKFSTLTKTSSKLARMMIKKGGTLSRDAGAKLRFGGHGASSSGGGGDVDGSENSQELLRPASSNIEIGGGGGGASEVLIQQQEQGMEEMMDLGDEGPLQWGDDKSSHAQFGETESLAALPSLVEPLCIILLDIFEFKEQNFWLKRNAAVLLLKQWWSVRANRTLEK